VEPPHHGLRKTTDNAQTNVASATAGPNTQAGAVKHFPSNDAWGATLLLGTLPKILFTRISPTLSLPERVPFFGGQGFGGECLLWLL